MEQSGLSSLQVRNMNMVADDRGREAELKGRDAFLTLKEKPRGHLACEVIDVVHAEKDSPMDSAKKDLEVTLRVGLVVKKLGVQIKSSYDNVRAHYNACCRMGVYIPILVVLPGEALDTVIINALHLLGKAFKYLFCGAHERRYHSQGQSPVAKPRFHRHWCPRPQQFHMVH